MYIFNLSLNAMGGFTISGKLFSIRVPLIYFNVSTNVAYTLFLEVVVVKVHPRQLEPR